MSRLLHFVVARSHATLAIVAAITVLAAAGLVHPRTLEPRLRLDPSVNSLLPADDPDRRFYDRVRTLFGSDETLIVALVADDVFASGPLSAVVRMTERIEEVGGVHHVVSLASALSVRERDGDLAIEPFLTEVPERPEALAALREEALANPVYAGNLVSPDGRATALVVVLREMSEQEYLERGVGLRVQAIAEEERGGAEVYITGAPWVKAETSRVMLADQGFVIPTAFALACAIALVAFRSLRGVVVPAATIGIALVWTLGLMGWTGQALNLVTTILPPLLLAIGFAYTIHVMTEYVHETGEDPPGTSDARPAVRRALGQVAPPVVLTAVTTCVGFLALLVSELPAVRAFAAFAAFGVLCTVVVALSFAPAVLSLLPPPRRREARSGAAVPDDRAMGALPDDRAAGELPLDRAADALARFDLRHRRWVLAAGALLAGIAVYGATQIRVSNDLIANFGEDAPVRRHFEAINRVLGGSNAFLVVLEAGERGAFQEPESLRAMQRLQSWLEAQPEVGSSTSLADYVLLLHRGFRGGDPEAPSLPDSRSLVSQLLFFGSSDELESYADAGYRTAAVHVRSRVMDSAEMASLTRRIESRLPELLPAGVEGTVTGNSVLVARTTDELARGQAFSLGIAFVAIYLVQVLLFTSFRVGFLALIPNALPVLVYFGVLGLSGVTLNAVTGLVACIVLGIAVDDTIHLMSRFSLESKRQADERAGIRAALRVVFRPVTYTTVALCLGFSVLLFTQLRNQIEFGALAAFTLGVAWLVDVTVTPALCSRIRIVTLWDLVTLNLGPDPQHTVPLFRGLRRGQARLVALMTRLESHPKGHALIRTGEEADAMYVVLDGELVVSLPGEAGSREVARLRRGDSVGEVALLHGRRTADVDAATDVRLLRLTVSDLERLRRRYPRTAARVYGNLSLRLAELVARSTERERALRAG